MGRGAELIWGTIQHKLHVADLLGPDGAYISRTEQSESQQLRALGCDDMTAVRRATQYDKSLIDTNKCYGTSICPWPR